MHPLHNSPSFLKLIDEDDPIFLFFAATMLDRDMLAIAVNWYHVGWFCLICDDALEKQHWENIQP
ncbi:hypothetical protein Hanom_Chr07g00597811 [Helianthus anomalus]